ncbi:MAG: hypothetical protein JST75_05640 [Bacteroidetes bacterium]|nr:hypothetical protein [Bacteroidota bacterium]
MNQKILASLLSIFICVTSFGQDSVLAKTIDDLTRKKYDLQNKTYWLLTREKIVPEADLGTEISVSLIGDSIYRIVCTGTNQQGKWAKEYYPLNGQLAFCYGSVDFYEGDGYKNWKGYPATEYRVYYQKGKLIHQKIDGVRNPDKFSKMLIGLPAEYASVLQWTRQKLASVIMN